MLAFLLALGKIYLVTTAVAAVTLGVILVVERLRALARPAGAARRRDAKAPQVLDRRGFSEARPG